MTNTVEIKYEEEYMGSLNHSIVQAQITGILVSDARFTIMVELSLDISKVDLTQFGLKAKEELKPDICLYPNSIWLQRRDVLKMADMPLLAIEVISPKQGIEDILAKFDAYFALGIKSCWLVTPALEAITVYSQPNHFNTYDMNDTEIVDNTVNIQLPINKVFRRINDV